MLHPVEPSSKTASPDAKSLVELTRRRDVQGAEGIFAQMAQGSLDSNT